MPTLSISKTKPNVEAVIWAADMAGTFVFAVEGAVSAMRGGLDLLGVMVVSFVAALGGGVIRDLLLGVTPPNAIRDWRYPALTFAAGLLTFLFHSLAQPIPDMLVTVVDAALAQFVGECSRCGSHLQAVHANGAVHENPVFRVLSLKE